MNITINKNMMTVTDQRVSMYHIGLVKDHGGHLVNQPSSSLFSVLKNKLKIKKVQLEKQTNRTP